MSDRSPGPLLGRAREPRCAANLAAAGSLSGGGGLAPLLPPAAEPPLEHLEVELANGVVDFKRGDERARLAPALGQGTLLRIDTTPNIAHEHHLTGTASHLLKLGAKVVVQLGTVEHPEERKASATHDLPQ